MGASPPPPPTGVQQGDWKKRNLGEGGWQSRENIRELSARGAWHSPGTGAERAWRQEGVRKVGRPKAAAACRERRRRNVEEGN